MLLQLKSALGRSLLLMFSIFSSCSWSTALLLSSTRGMVISNGNKHRNVFCGHGNRDVLVALTLGEKSDSNSRVTLKCNMLPMKPRTGDDLDDETNTATPASTTRQIFLFDLCSRVASTSAIVTGMHNGIPAMATTMEPRNIGDVNGDVICGLIDDDNSTCACTPRARARILSLTLRSLPVSGCWAAPVTLSQNLDVAVEDENSSDDDFFAYLAVVDTGSPFLTAPPAALGALRQTKDIATATKTTNTLGMEVKGKQTKNKLFSRLTEIFQPESNNDDDSHQEGDESYEQYGNTVGGVQWRVAPYLTLIGNGRVDNVIDRGITDYPCDNNNKNCCPRSSSDINTLDDTKFLPGTEIESIVIQDQTNFVLGVPSEEVIMETGGIFFGLMTVDAARPTPLQQLGYDAFALQFEENREIFQSRRIDQRKKDKNEKETRNNNDPATLVLWNGKQNNNGKTNNIKSSDMTPISTLIDRFDPYSIKLFDLTQFGPNLHHYAALCDRFECQWAGNDSNDSIAFDCVENNDSNICTPTSASANHISLSRPLIAVFDTGLSGCIFSDTLWEEIQLERQRQNRHRNETQQQRRGSDIAKDNDDEDKRVPMESNSEEITPIGCTVWLPTISRIPTASSSTTPLASKYSSSAPGIAVELSSISSYWRFQSFRLPWWYADNATKNDGEASKAKSKNNYPHVVVLGSTFWRNPNVRELAIDTVSERVKIVTMKQASRFAS
mmetsp:Transcript_8993/g.17811  ORF Transcript_8993/g.17811 Transcript_8993/m.17811 type:complete len:726 (+) Transcript_8993:103-2280(+)